MQSENISEALTLVPIAQPSGAIPNHCNGATEWCHCRWHYLIGAICSTGWGYNFSYLAGISLTPFGEDIIPTTGFISIESIDTIMVKGSEYPSFARPQRCDLWDYFC